MDTGIQQFLTKKELLFSGNWHNKVEKGTKQMNAKDFKGKPRKLTL